MPTRDEALKAATDRAERQSKRRGIEYAVVDRWAKRGCFRVLRTTDLNEDQRRDVAVYVRLADDEALSYGVRCSTCGAWETACTCDESPLPSAHPHQRHQR